MNIETVGELIGYLLRLPPHLRILKNDTTLNRYTNIVVTESAFFDVKPSEESPGDPEQLASYQDAHETDPGVFQAVII